jgi:NADH:ubiquinone oxidoreductase subunit 4 (subunit M)
MNLREIATFVPLIAWSIWIGLYPKPYFEILQKPVSEIVERVRPGYFAAPTQNASTGQVGNLPHEGGAR